MLCSDIPPQFPPNIVDIDELVDITDICGNPVDKDKYIWFCTGENIRKDERKKVLSEFCNEFWNKPIPDSKVDFVDRVGEIIRLIRKSGSK